MRDHHLYITHHNKTIVLLSSVEVQAFMTSIRRLKFLFCHCLHYFLLLPLTLGSGRSGGDVQALQNIATNSIQQTAPMPSQIFGRVGGAPGGGEQPDQAGEDVVARRGFA